MSSEHIALMAHLMRRAGFTATPDELEAYTAKGYEATVEELLYPGDAATIPEDVIRRLHVDQYGLWDPVATGANWMYRMINSRCPLEEKATLFWHGLFATGYQMLHNTIALKDQVDMFRRNCLGSFRDLLVELSKDPAMIIWLDNNDNHNGAINENYGRELLELFSMGIGNYTEQDIKECARAFTGWTIANEGYMAARVTADSVWPYDRIGWHFEYRSDDHDDGQKTILGETGRFNGEDAVDIVVRQPTTAEFICRRLFQFFVADEVDVDGEQVVADAITAYFESQYEIRSVLRTLFNSEYFKSDKARLARVKGPVELVVGAVRLAGSYRTPTHGVHELAGHATLMGQALNNPVSVEGWHEGAEWIDSGGIVERVNFVSRELGDVTKPGVRELIERLAGQNGDTLSPDDVVGSCLEFLGHMPVSGDTRDSLVDHVAKDGDLDLRGHSQGDESEQRVGELLSLIVSTREFQKA